MKRFYFFRHICPILPSVLFLLLTVTGCNKKNEPMIWDMYPVKVQIHLLNAAGENLLIPATQGNLYGKNISVEYNGTVYELEWNKPKQTRYYLPMFEGLTLKEEYRQTGDGFENDSNLTYLCFGEFDGAENQDISLKLKIEDYPEIWDIGVVHSIKWKNDKPEVKNSASLNGKTVPYDKIIITL